MVGPTKDVEEDVRQAEGMDNPSTKLKAPVTRYPVNMYTWIVVAAIAVGVVFCVFKEPEFGKTLFRGVSKVSLTLLDIVTI